jgi:hypothetical protein
MSENKNKEKKKPLPVEQDPRMWAMMARDRARLSYGGSTALILVACVGTYLFLLFHYLVP